jgi:hypothetical protein
MTWMLNTEHLSESEVKLSCYCEVLRIPHCLDNRLTVNCDILATSSSTYSPVRTSQEAHSGSVK